MIWALVIAFSIYALISWLHSQFHLPRVICNASNTPLAILGFLVLSISLNINTPFVTLQSGNLTYLCTTGLSFLL
ncbi:hypothetical protein BDR07DRAFT_1432124 [Suillus spraguei]|nr:hypothetical protein BDR07DRAFT_1432124 [Suillus spraguei]